MFKCDNCDLAADYRIEDAGSLPQAFCDVHLPTIYVVRAQAGQLKRIVAEPVAVEADTAAEEVLETEDAPVEEAKKPIKRAAKKK